MDESAGLGQARDLGVEIGQSLFEHLAMNRILRHRKLL
jgi:hypothetical protein